MKKLNLDSLRVDSFATVSDGASGRGTVQGQWLEIDTGTGACPVSHGGTCVISCRRC